MKIQYVLVSVSRETEYFCNDKRVELVREEVFFRGNSEQEVESWLEVAFVASKVIYEKRNEIRDVENSIAWKNKGNKILGFKNPELLTFEHLEKLQSDYSNLVRIYEAGEGYSLLDTNSEYRIVKVYSSD